MASNDPPPSSESVEADAYTKPDLSLMFAAIYVAVVLLFYFHVRRQCRQRSTPSLSPSATTAQARSALLGSHLVVANVHGQAVIISTTLKPPSALQHVTGFQYQRFAGNALDCDQNVPDRYMIMPPAEINFTRGFETAYIHPHLGRDASTQSPSETTDNATGRILCTSVIGLCSRASFKLEAEDTCFVCMERCADAILLECGHGGLCVECANALWGQPARQCPLCRGGFAAIMRIVAREARTARVEPVHYLLCEEEHVHDITAAWPADLGS